VRLWIAKWWITGLFGWVDWALRGALEGLSQLAWEHLRPKIDGDEDRKRYTEKQNPLHGYFPRNASLMPPMAF
jgi:hypothetical protein